MSKVVFLVQGSKAEPYRVTFEKTEGGMRAFCDCAAGTNGKSCKHRTRILQGDSTDIVSPNSAAVEEVVSWGGGETVKELQKEIATREKKIALLEKEISVLRKSISKALTSAA